MQAVQQTEGQKAAYRSARETVSSTKRNAQPMREMSAPRFFVQFTTDVLKVDTDAVPNRWLLRGEITPCTDYEKLYNVKDIPDGARIKGSEVYDKDGYATWAKVLQHAGPDAERLMANEQASEDGLFHVESLFDAWGVYEQLDLNQIFYPAGLDGLPETHAETLAYLERRRAEIAKDGAVPAELRKTVLAVADELVRAAKYAESCHMRRIEQTHQRMRIPEGQQDRKLRYDEADEEALRRTKHPRIESSLESTAKALEQLSGERTINVTVPQNDSLVQLLQAQQEQMRRQDERHEAQMALLREELKALKGQLQPNQPKRN